MKKNMITAVCRMCTSPISINLRNLTYDTLILSQFWDAEQSGSDLGGNLARVAGSIWGWGKSGTNVLVWY